MAARCETCVHWSDWSKRVWARLSSGDFVLRTAIGEPVTVDRDADRGVELRACQYRPPPTVQQNGVMYTDASYTCSAHKEMPE